MLDSMACPYNIAGQRRDFYMTTKGQIRNKKSGIVRTYEQREDGKVCVQGTDHYYTTTIEKLIASGKWELAA